MACTLFPGTSVGNVCVFTDRACFSAPSNESAFELASDVRRRTSSPNFGVRRFFRALSTFSKHLSWCSKHRIHVFVLFLQVTFDGMQCSSDPRDLERPHPVFSCLNSRLTRVEFNYTFKFVLAAKAHALRRKHRANWEARRRAFDSKESWKHRRSKDEGECDGEACKTTQVGGASRWKCED